MILSVAGLRKTYGGTVAVDGISFGVNQNEIVGLLGPNGAGKTTTINIVLGVLEPDAGNIYIDGLDIASERSAAMSRTNFTAVYAPLPGNLTVSENLRVFSRLYGVTEVSKRVDELIRQFDLEVFRNRKCGVLSAGEQMRVGLAKAMLNYPKLLLLDEPTASLDPASAAEVRVKICEYAAQSGNGILWTSHNMYEVQDVCSRVLFLSHGKILLEGSPKTLPQEYGKKTLEELFIAVAREPLTLEQG